MLTQEALFFILFFSYIGYYITDQTGVRVVVWPGLFLIIVLSFCRDSDHTYSKQSSLLVQTAEGSQYIASV